MNDHAFGREAEAIAENYYLSRGYRLLERNFRCRRGELDLVLLKGTLLLIAEVKGRRKNWEQHAWQGHWGLKQRRMRSALRAFLASRPGLDFDALRLEIVFVTHGRVAARFPG